VGAWEGLAPNQELATVDGEALRVLYPGRANAGSGPDFLGAVLATAHGELRGDVEVHSKSSDWVRHGHGADPHYAAVVLHVVGRDDGVSSRPPGGQQLRLLELNQPETAREPGVGERTFPCAENVETSGVSARLSASLGRAGDRRFDANAARLLARLRAAEGAERAAMTEQLAYEEIAGALGYGRNEMPMRDLAADVPLREVRRGSPLRAEARLLGAAGLLPSGRHLPARRRRDAYAEALERAWGGGAPIVRAYRWDAAHVRPENSPVRRVVGLAHLALRWPPEGLVLAVRDALSKDKPASLLAALVTIACPSGYWLEHWDVGIPVRGMLFGDAAARAGSSRARGKSNQDREGGAGSEAAALIGPSRAADVVVNVLLPFAAALGEQSSDAKLVEAAHAAYAAHPPLTENWITRLVRNRTGIPTAGDGNVVRSARLQQGLIAIHEATCRVLRCSECLLAAT
jgi:hypothetical protein